MAGGLLGLALGCVMMTVLEAVLRNQPMNPSFVPYWIPAEATIGINGPVLLFTSQAGHLLGFDSFRSSNVNPHARHLAGRIKI
jgi:hypothetical protein